MASFLGRMGKWSFNSRSVLQRRFASSESSHVEIDCNAIGNRRLMIAAITLPITLYLVSLVMFANNALYINTRILNLCRVCSFVKCC